MTKIVIASLIGAAYLFVGIVNWLVSALELLGDTSKNQYLSSVNSFSKKNIATEVFSVAYLVLAWPLHLALKSSFASDD